MVLEIDWFDPQIVGAIAAAIIGLTGVLITIFFTRNEASSKSGQQKQTSFFSRNSKQFQAGRDIIVKEKPGKKD